MECLKREILEELNVVLIEESIRYFGTFEADAYGHSKDTIVKMTCYFADYSGELRANNEIDRFDWLTFDDKEKTSFVDQIIFDTLHAQGLIK